MKGIVLIGFMGTGKTVVGRELAGRLQWPLIDTDDLIVAAAGKPVTRIFAEEGEPAFRARETDVLRALAAQTREPRIVSTGGGIVLAAANWPLLRALGDVVCLTAAPEEILRRVGTADGRPLLAGTPAEVRTRIRELLAQRRDAYARADFTLVTDGLTPAAAAEKILSWRERNTEKK